MTDPKEPTQSLESTQPQLQSQPQASPSKVTTALNASLVGRKSKRERESSSGKTNKADGTKPKEILDSPGNNIQKNERAKSKAQTSPKSPRKPSAKRARKGDLLKSDDSTTAPTHSHTPSTVLPSPPSSPRSMPVTPSKHQINRHTGRQNAGAYSQEEVHALQSYINTKISLDWEAIAQHVGKTTGVYRHKDNLRTFYGTIVFKQVYDSFPKKNGQGGGGLVAVDVMKEGEQDAETEEGVRKVCGGCGARLVEGLREKEGEGSEGGEGGEGSEEGNGEGKSVEKNDDRVGLVEEGKYTEGKNPEQRKKDEDARQDNLSLQPEIGMFGEDQQNDGRLPV